MTDKVQRYDRISTRMHGGGIKICSMIPTEHGQYVLYSDYQALETSLRDTKRALEIAVDSYCVWQADELTQEVRQKELDRLISKARKEREEGK